MKNIAFTFGAIVFTLGMIGNNVILGEDVKAGQECGCSSKRRRSKA
jgi:hypothetical protein